MLTTSVSVNQLTFSGNINRMAMLKINLLFQKSLDLILYFHVGGKC